MYVICFYWQGDRWQEEGYKPPEGHINLQQVHMNRTGVIDSNLPARYVNNLYWGVKRFASKDFKFICFTNEAMDVDPNIELRSFPLITKSGVLPRLYMFSQDAGLFGDQVLCLDLDVVIVGSLKKLMDYNGLFCARSKFRPGEGHKLDGDVMGFRAGNVTEGIFWQPFVSDVKRAVHETKGRERYWMRDTIGEMADRWEHHAPGNVISYKWHVRQDRKVPEGASVISCHGIPRPHEIKDKWIKEYWK